MFGYVSLKPIMSSSGNVFCMWCPNHNGSNTPYVSNRQELSSWETNLELPLSRVAQRVRMRRQEGERGAQHSSSWTCFPWRMPQGRRAMRSTWKKRRKRRSVNWASAVLLKSRCLDDCPHIWTIHKLCMSIAVFVSFYWEGVFLYHTWCVLQFRSTQKPLIKLITLAVCVMIILLPSFLC